MSYTPIRITFEKPDSLPFEAPAISREPRRKNAIQNRQRLRSRNGRTRNRSQTEGSDTDYPILVHCHLCWDWVWQRPQQFLSRLSQRRKILFVETIGPDPELATPLARFRTLEDYPNITVLRLQFPSWQWNDGTYVDSQRRRIVREFMAGPGAGAFDNPIQWFYDPMAVTAFAGHMGEVLTVYDCMDELSKFRFAPPELAVREAELLERADVVFCGGYKLFTAKTAYNPNCHFFGCGVDGDHFGKAREAQTPVAPEIKSLRKPVLGYFGVIDERIDYELLTQLAESNPDWSIAMVGPVLKVDPNTLPKRRNLHWLGQRAYADLPAFCKGFDICLMPFALNESTEYINPTKALEYMATGRPIVSTAVADVVRNFGSVVKIASDRDGFVQICQHALDQPDSTAIAKGLRMVKEQSWESIVAQLEHRMEEALIRNRCQEVAA